MLKLLIACFLVPSVARAVLDETISSVEARSTTNADAYQKHEVSKSKIEIRQFANKNGHVFAVAWSGKSHPKLQTLLGSRYADYLAALKEAKKERPGHAPLNIEAHGLHIEMGGSPRALFGRIWITKQIPTGMNQDEIK